MKIKLLALALLTFTLVGCGNGAIVFLMDGEGRLAGTAIQAESSSRVTGNRIISALEDYIDSLTEEQKPYVTFEKFNEPGRHGGKIQFLSLLASENGIVFDNTPFGGIREIGNQNGMDYLVFELEGVPGEGGELYQEAIVFFAFRSPTRDRDWILETTLYDLIEHGIRFVAR